MLQLVQNLQSGEFSFIDAPMPARGRGHLLVRNTASLISTGTERSTVRAAQASLLGKARQRPERVKQVLHAVRKQGLLATARHVRAKFLEPLTLGYSSAGELLEGDSALPSLTPGRRVACGGANFACHAEVVSVPKNLVVPVPDGITDEEACFATVGAIALQSVRRSRVRVGDRVLVIGLGLIGQLVWQLLAHAGCQVLATDISPEACQLARKLGLELSLDRHQDDVEGCCKELTSGHGVDAVIIAAATSSPDPVTLAGTVCRERGVVCVVGAVPMNIPRDLYYQKELDLVVSRSYGPGRYDRDYETRGIDYPYPYVRWTEGRNMQAFLESVASRRVNVLGLVTHRFPFERSVAAYDMVCGSNPEFHAGIVLTYGQSPRERSLVRVAEAHQARPGDIGIAVVGVGSFAKGSLLPELARIEGARPHVLIGRRGFTAVETARRFGFPHAGSRLSDALGSPDVHAVVIATRHNSHEDLVADALAAGKHVFVEKPLCISPDGLDRILPLAVSTRRLLQVGFNRRFSPFAVALRSVLSTAASSVHVTYRVNAGPLPRDHWLLDPEEGGGRIIGEACHFVDLITYLAGENVTDVHAIRCGNDSAGVTSISLGLERGSTAVLVYQANAATAIAKEYLEAFAGGRGGIVEDWRRLRLWDGRGTRTLKSRQQRKGIPEELRAFIGGVRTGKAAIPLSSLRNTTETTFAIMRSLELGERVPVAVNPAPPSNRASLQD